MSIERRIVRSTKIHPHGNTTARDTDIMDRDAWRRLYRSCRDVLMSGGEVHIRPVVEGDGIPVSMPNPLKGRVEELEAELAALREFANGWSEFRSQFDDIQYHHLGMGCGIEDRGIHDRYAACEHGWECAMNRVAERFPEIDTLDALRAQGKEGAT